MPLPRRKLRRRTKCPPQSWTIEIASVTPFIDASLLTGLTIRHAYFLGVESVRSWGDGSRRCGYSDPAGRPDGAGGVGRRVLPRSRCGGAAHPPVRRRSEGRRVGKGG